MDCVEDREPGAVGHAASRSTGCPSNGMPWPLDDDWEAFQRPFRACSAPGSPARSARTRRPPTRHAHASAAGTKSTAARPRRAPIGQRIRIAARSWRNRQPSRTEARPAIAARMPRHGARGRLPREIEAESYPALRARRISGRPWREPRDANMCSGTRRRDSDAKPLTISMKGPCQWLTIIKIEFTPNS